MILASRIRVAAAVSVTFVSMALGLGGCYEELDTPPAPQAQQQSASPRQDGLIGPVQTGGSSALGKAKQSAENTIDAAQRHSEKVAEQADEIMGGGGSDDVAEDQER